MKKRDGKKIFEAMDGIGDDLVNEARAYRPEEKKTEPKRRTPVFSGARRYATALIAAALVLALSVSLLAVFITPGATGPDGKNKPTPIVLSGEAYATDRLAEIPDELKSVSVTADGTDSRLISTSASFRITTCGSCDVDTLAKYVTVTPSTYMSVTAVSDTEFELTPAEDGLVPGTVYRVMIGNPDNPAASYAFQTESTLVVKSVLPTDKAKDVPVNTGIEITFSDSVKTEDLDRYITVSPEVKGSWYRYPDGRTVALVPEKNLALDTVYTVKIAAGIESTGGKKLAAETTSYFRTMKKAESSSAVYAYINANGIYKNLTAIYSPEEEATFRFNFQSRNVTSIESAMAYLYKYDTPADAARAILEREKTIGTDELETYDTSGLTLVSKAKADVPLYQNAYGYFGYSSATCNVYFGQGLEKGVYLVKAVVEASGEDKTEKTGKTAITATCYGFIQISDLRAFTISSDGQTLVWVNGTDGDTVGGAKIEGTAFERADGWANALATGFTPVSAVTGKDGTALLKHGDLGAAILTVSTKDDALVLCAQTAREDKSEYIMRYVYTDREAYFTDDKVNFYGFIVPYNGGELPKTLYLQTGNSGIKTKITYNPQDGSFSGSYAIENMRAGGIYLKIVDADGRIYASKYVRITEEEKPVITASLSFDKLFYEFGDTATVTLRASFFDGTPAPGFSFAVRGSVNGTTLSPSPSTATTDENGECVYTFRLGYCMAWSTNPVMLSVTAELVKFEMQTLTTSGSAFYFHSDYVYTINYDKDCRRVTLNYRDTSAIRTADDLNYGFIRENTVGAPAKGKVSYKLIKYVVTKTEKKVYDSYTKKTYTRYEYSTSKHVVKKGTLEFVSGEARLPLYEVEGFTGGYYYDLEFYDGGNIYTSTVGATRGGYYYSDSDAIKTGLFTDKDAYAVGDTVKVTMTDGHGETAGRLFAVFADGLVAYGVGEEFAYTYKTEMIPGSVVYGVTFSADTSFGTFGYSIVRPLYDISSAALDVSVETDKDSYKPGETAVLKIKGASGGTVLVSIVDEACFALEDQTADALQFFMSAGKVNSSEIYRYYYYYNYSYNYNGIKPITVDGRFGAFDTSIRLYSRDNGMLEKALAETESAEAPAEYAETDGNDEKSGDYYVRKYFADNPVFETVTLDKKGEGTLIFTVPDNLTTWRVTATAVSGLGGGLADIKLGNTVDAAVCTQPFFVNVSSAARYIVGDDVSASFRSFGKNASGKVSYRAVLTLDGETVADVKASGEPLDYTRVNFGKLEAGQYKLTVYAECGDAKDAVETSLAIVESNLTVPVTRDVEIAGIHDISPALYPVTLTFYNATAENAFYDGLLFRLSRGNSSERADMLAAKYVALALEAQLYGGEAEAEIKAAADRLSGYGDGFFSLLSYSAVDPVLTAKILALCPGIADASRRDKLVSLYEEIVASSMQIDEETLCASLLGLAALGEPVLDRLYSTASVAGGYPAEAKLYLAAAFACIGDYPYAYGIYAGVKDETGVYDGEYGTLYINGGTLDANIRLTSAAMLTAARVSSADAYAMARYLAGNPTRDESPEIALACYLRFFIPTADAGTKTMSYCFSGGDAKTVELTRGRIFTITLTKSELAAFTLVYADEGIKVKASYLGSAEEAYTEKSDRVTIEKTITPYLDNLYRVTVSISGTSSKIYETFDLTDCIPSGARYVSLYSGGYSYSSKDTVRTDAWIYNSSGQNMRGRVTVYNSRYASSRSYVNTCPEYKFSVTVSYVIRGAVDGEFVVESASLRNSATGFFAASERSTVVIDSTKLVQKK